MHVYAPARVGILQVLILPIIGFRGGMTTEHFVRLAAGRQHTPYMRTGGLHIRRQSAHVQTVLADSAIKCSCCADQDPVKENGVRRQILKDLGQAGEASLDVEVKAAQAAAQRAALLHKLQLRELQSEAGDRTGHFLSKAVQPTLRCSLTPQLHVLDAGLN